LNVWDGEGIMLYWIFCKICFCIFHSSLV